MRGIRDEDDQRSQYEPDKGFKMGMAVAVSSSEKALKVKPAPGNTAFTKEIWIPHSQIHDDSEVFNATRNADGALVVTRWWAKKEGYLK